MSYNRVAGVNAKITVQAVAWFVQHFTPIISEEENITKHYVSKVSSEL